MTNDHRINGGAVFKNRHRMGAITTYDAFVTGRGITPPILILLWMLRTSSAIYAPQLFTTGVLHSDMNALHSATDRCSVLCGRCSALCYRCSTHYYGYSTVCYKFSTLALLRMLHTCYGCSTLCYGCSALYLRILLTKPVLGQELFPDSLSTVSSAKTFPV
jgi:hypothetical protein